MPTPPPLPNQISAQLTSPLLQLHLPNNLQSAVILNCTPRRVVKYYGTDLLDHAQSIFAPLERTGIRTTFPSLFRCNLGAKCSTLHRSHTADRKFCPSIWHSTGVTTPHRRDRNQLNQLRISRLGVRLPPGAPERGGFL